MMQQTDYNNGEIERQPEPGLVGGAHAELADRRSELGGARLVFFNNPFVLAYIRQKNQAKINATVDRMISLQPTEPLQPAPKTWINPAALAATIPPGQEAISIEGAQHAVHLVLEAAGAAVP